MDRTAVTGTPDDSNLELKKKQAGKKMNVLMSKPLKAAYFAELRKYREAKADHRDSEAWSFLERAHVLGQYHPFSHTGSHFRMLVFALGRADFQEAAGQLLRVSVGWLGSLLNRIPVGNTGGANVPILQPMPIPEDLRHLLTNADTEAKGLSGFR